MKNKLNKKRVWGYEMKKNETYTMDEINALSELSDSELDNIVGGTDTEDDEDSCVGCSAAKKLCIKHLGSGSRVCAGMS
ncbi:MAG: type A2 lantipeptide [Lachnospiraceae bacterium]|nr:type A2 lantipeptide [Candidatus Colinaster equi]